jgi:hypothetical protein
VEGGRREEGVRRREEGGGRREEGGGRREQEERREEEEAVPLSDWKLKYRSCQVLV